MAKITSLESMYRAGKQYGQFPEDADFGKTDSELWDEIVTEFGQEVA